MDMISTIDAFVSRHQWLVFFGTLLPLMWFWWRKGRGTRLSLGAFQVLNLGEGWLMVFAIVSVLNLSGTVIMATGLITNFDALKAIAHLLINLVVAFTVGRAIEALWASKSEFIDEGYIPGLPRVLLFAALFLLAISVFGVGYGLSISSLYISTGALAAVIAFAMQQTLSDLFSGISLSVERPFKIGDLLELEDGNMGEVRDLNWRATRLKAWDNSTLVIPNGALAKQTFRNHHGANHRYSPWYTLSLPAEMDPRLAKALILDAALKCKRTLNSPLPSVRLIDSGSVPYQYTVWLHFADYSQVFAGQEEFYRELHYALREAGVQAAAPAQDVRFQAAKATDVRPPSIRYMLQSLDFTSFLNEEERESLVMRSYSETVDAGQVILPEGITADSVDIIWTGIVETSVMDARGARRTLEPLSAGEYFGLASMLMDAPSFQTFTASTDVTLLRVDRTCFKEVASTREDLLQGLADIVNHRMMNAEVEKNRKDRAAGPETLRDVFRSIEQFMGGRHQD